MQIFIYWSRLAPLNISDTGTFKVFAGDEFERFIDENDGDGKLHYCHPFLSVKWGDLEHLRKDLDVEDDEMKDHRQTHGQQKPDVNPWGHHEKGLVL